MKKENCKKKCRWDQSRKVKTQLVMFNEIIIISNKSIRFVTIKMNIDRDLIIEERT